MTVGAITCLIGACGENGVMSRFMLKSDRIIIERRPDPAYDKLFPYYVELCATSQFRSRARAASLVMRSCTSKEPALVLKTLAVHEPNDLYDTTFRLFTLLSPLRMGKTGHAVELLSDDRFVKLDANLRYFRDKYNAIIAKHDEFRDRLASVRGTPYRQVEQLHYEYIKMQRAEVESMLNRLPRLGSVSLGRKAE